MDLNQFIEHLRTEDQLLQVDAEIDGRLEIAALTDLASKQGGPALLFSRVKGSKISVATNLFGSDQRMARVLGHGRLASFGAALREALISAAGASSADRLQTLLTQVNVERQDSARVQRPVDLSFLPDLRYWPQEQRSFLTLAVVITRAPQSAEQNYGLYRVGIAGNRQLTLNLLPGSGAGRHLELWQARGEKMPVAVVLGADPALIFAAAASLPHACSEAKFSALLNESPFYFCHCATIPLQCPSSGQIVLEGWIVGDTLINEGPFGCFKGNYGGSNSCPLIDVSAVAQVERPVLPLTLAGPLPMEDCWIAKANLEILRARLAIDLPELDSLEMPLDAAFHGLYFVRCSSTDIPVEVLARKLQEHGYLRPLKMLVLLRADETITEVNWRHELKQIDQTRIWQAPAADLADLLSGRPGDLAADTNLQNELSRRLPLCPAELSESWGENGSRSDG